MTVTWQKIITQNIGDTIYADIAHTHTAVEYVATGGSVPTGTVDSGTYASTNTHDGTPWAISEAASTPGFDVRLTFSGVVSFNEVRGIVWYNGSVAHTVNVQVYNYISTTWEDYTTIPATAGYAAFDFFIDDPDEHVDGSGNATIRFYHSSAGNASNDIYIDYIVLIAAGFSALPDHSQLTGLDGDDHLQYALLAGRSGGQTIYGGTASGDDLYVYSTSNATKGDIVLANGGGRVGIGQLPDAGILQVYAGNSGGTPTNADYVPVSIENDTSAYVQMLTPNNAVSGLLFSDPEDFDNGYISYNHSTQTMTFAADAVDTMYLTDGNVGIRTTSPLATIDISSGKYPTLLIGADFNAYTRTNATGKYAYLALPHYTNAEEAIEIARFASTSTENSINIGGESSSFNAATSIAFWTAANNTTVTGTQRMVIDSGGNVGIGTTSPGAKLEVIGATQDAIQTVEKVGAINASAQTKSFLLRVRADNSDPLILYRTDASEGTDPKLGFSVGSDTPALTVIPGGNVGVATVTPQKKLHVAGTILVDGDEGGYAGTVGFTDVTNGVSSGNGTVKMAGTTARDSTGWLKIYVGTTAVYLPYFTTIN